MSQPYYEEISRSNPLTIIFLIDHSGSMEDPFGGEIGLSKAQATSDALNRLISTMVIINTMGDEVYDRLIVSAIGYGGSVKSAFSGALGSETVAPLSEIADNPLRVEERRQKQPDGAGGIIEVENPFPIWIEPTADGVTPMKQAFSMAKKIVAERLNEKPGAYPPIVINITDGAYTPPGPAGDPTPIVEEIKSMKNANGSNPLVYNCHITHLQVPAVLYPPSADGIQDKYGAELFKLSSRLPEPIVSMAQSANYAQIQDGSRGFVFNADLVQLIEFLDWGTKAAVEIRPGQDASLADTGADEEIRPG